MPWFRLEESFHANPKVLTAGNPAVGLWVRCATWSAQQLTDGTIPAHIARQFATSRREITALSTSRLWVPVDDTFVLPDWLEYQPSAAEVKERRKRDAERKRAARNAGAAAVDHGTDGRFTSHREEDPFR